MVGDERFGAKGSAIRDKRYKRIFLLLRKLSFSHPSKIKKSIIQKTNICFLNNTFFSNGG